MALLLVVAALSSCDKASDKAQREYILLMKGGASAEERCAKLHEIAAAYLKEENSQEYPMAKIKADMCDTELSLSRRRNRY